MLVGDVVVILYVECAETVVIEVDLMMNRVNDKLLAAEQSRIFRRAQCQGYQPFLIFVGVDRKIEMIGGVRLIEGHPERLGVPPRFSARLL